MRDFDENEFEYAADGLWIDGKFYLPVYGGDDGDDGDSGDEGDDSGGDQEEGATIFDEPEPLPSSLSDRSLSNKGIQVRGRNLAISGVPLQVSMLLKALSSLRARARGSTAEILPSITGQIDDLRKQYSAASQALSRRLGAAGGGQIRRGRTQLLTTAAGNYGDLLTQAQKEGTAGYLNLLGGIQPFLSGTSREPNVSNLPPNPQDAALLGKSLQGIVSLANQFKSPSYTYNPTQTYGQQTYYTDASQGFLPGE